MFLNLLLALSLCKPELTLCRARGPSRRELVPLKAAEVGSLSLLTGKYFYILKESESFMHLKKWSLKALTGP